MSLKRVTTKEGEVYFIDSETGEKVKNEKLSNLLESEKRAIENTNKEVKTKGIVFASIGAILGIPLSYYFQSSMVQNKVGGVGGYLKHFDEIVKDGNLGGNVILSILIFAIIGGLIGYLIDKNEVKK